MPEAYDLLLVATGGHAAAALHGALTFRGADQGEAIREILDSLPQSIAFAAPPCATWALPIYELALLSAAELRRRGATTEVTLVTPRAHRWRSSAGAQASSLRRSSRGARSRWSPPPAPLRGGAGAIELSDPRGIAHSPRAVPPG